MDKKERVPLQMQCVVLFQSEPARVETIEGLEERLGVSREELQPVMDMLIKQGIIQRIDEASPPLFRYKEPESEVENGESSELETL